MRTSSDSTRSTAPWICDESVTSSVSGVTARPDGSAAAASRHIPATLPSAALLRPAPDRCRDWRRSRERTFLRLMLPYRSRLSPFGRRMHCAAAGVAATRRPRRNNRRLSPGHAKTGGWTPGAMDFSEIPDQSRRAATTAAGLPPGAKEVPGDRRESPVATEWRHDARSAVSGSSPVLLRGLVGRIHRRGRRHDRVVHGPRGPLRGGGAQLHGEMLSSAGEGDLWIIGGGNVATRFADEGLLDEVAVTVVPVVLGKGKPVFERRLPGGALQLTGVFPRANGMVELRYAVRR